MKAFVYIDQDLGVTPNKWYIRFKMGNYWEIGYTYPTHSKIVRKLREERPKDFRWFLVSCGSKEEMVQEEAELLKSVDAKNNPLYYNLHNGNGNFLLKNHTNETKKKIRVKAIGRPSPMLGKPSPLKGKKREPFTEEWLDNMRKPKTKTKRMGRYIRTSEIREKLSKIHHNLKKPWAAEMAKKPEIRLKNRLSHLGKSHGPNTKEQKLLIFKKIKEKYDLGWSPKLGISFVNFCQESKNNIK